MAVPRDVLEIRLFGGFSVQYEGEPLPPLPSRSARLLLAWLALNAGRPQARSLLTDRFWPDAVEARARRRLSHALWQVQDGLGEMAPDHAYLVTRGDEVLFDAASPYTLDVEEFEQRLDRIDQSGTIDDAGLRSLRRCVSLYQGDLLAGSYETWVLEEQERLRQRYVTALGRLVEASKKRGNFEEALTFAQRLTHQAPLREDVHREVMRLCVLLGQPSQALEQFERCRSVLMEELGTQPSAETVQLRARISETRDVGVSRRAPVEQLVSRRLVGRDDERVALVDQLERTLAGATGMVFVEGEPGIGKSQLLAQATDDARWRGFTVLWGDCAGPDVPYAALREALQPELGPVRVAQLRAHVEPVWLQDASRLLEPLAVGQAGAAGRPGARPVALDGADGAERMREAMVRVLTGFAAVEPIMLVIEDAQRADQETLEVLRALGRHAPASRLLVVMTFRDADARHDELVWSGLRAVDRDFRPVRIRLEPLSAFETAGLLREVLGTTEVPAAFAESVHRESGGNPLYTLELLRALRDRGSLGEQVRDRLDTLEVPVTDGLRTLIGDRLDRLDAAASDLVEFGAVLGADFTLETLRIGSHLDDRDLSTAVAELVRRNLVEVSGESCRFTHAATRRVVLSRIDDDERQALHAAAGDALEQTHPDRVEALASHFGRAGLPQRALPYLRLAASRARGLHAYATAAAHLTSAVELSEQVLGTTDDRFALAAELEQVLGVLGHRDEQAAALDRLEVLAGDEPERLVEVHLRRATWLGHVDRLADAEAVARRAADLVPADAPHLRGRALTALGQVLSWTGDNAAAVAVLEEATDLLVDDPVAAGQARFSLGAALRAIQRFDEAGAQLGIARSQAEVHDDRVGEVQALGALADLHAETAQADEAVALYERAVELARTIGYRHREGVGLVNLGTVRLAHGDPVPALAAYDQAVTVFEGLGNRRGIAIVQLNRAWSRHRWFGHDDDAERDALAAHRYLVEVGNRGLSAVCLETLAGIATRRGQHDRAAEHLADALAAAQAAGDQRAEVQVVRGQVELALDLGDPARAAEFAQSGLEMSRDLGISEFSADLASLQALALLASDAHEPAWEQAGVAIANLASSGEPHRIHHRVSRVAVHTGRAQVGRHHQLVAYRLLLSALEGLDERAREHAIQAVDEHRAIADSGRAVSPRTVTLSMAHRAAPRGRALASQETVQVTLELAPPPSSRDERHRLLLDVLDQIDRQDAQATVHDLATALDVSTSTIRRDLRELRQMGHEPATRGTGTG